MSTHTSYTFELHIFKAYRTVDDILLLIEYVWLDSYSDMSVVYSKTIDPLVAWQDNIFNNYG